MKNSLIVITLLAALIFGGCASLQLQPVDFAWAAEEILDIESNGMVTARQYSVSFNVKPLLQKEFAADTMKAKSAKMIRLIRDKAGYYFITGPDFKNVYVFNHGDASLALSNTISISQEKAMDDPKFNQRDAFIELMNGGVTLKLNKGGIMQGGAK
jgi:hypothetical protein